MRDNYPRRYKELEDVKFALDKATTVSVTDVKGIFFM